jgi:hypothetical protein
MKSPLAAILLTGFALLAATPAAYAWGSLEAQQVDGFSRYCVYSGGGALTVGAAELCPITNEGTDKDGSPTVTLENRNGGFGSIKEQIVKGASRYCLYTDGAVRTVGSAELCPITDQ